MELNALATQVIRCTVEVEDSIRDGSRGVRDCGRAMEEWRTKGQPESDSRSSRTIRK